MLLWLLGRDQVEFDETSSVPLGHERHDEGALHRHVFVNTHFPAGWVPLHALRQ